MLYYALWIFQTLTGIYLFIGLYLHIFISPFTDYPILNTLFILSALFHGINGMTGIINESFKGKGWRRAHKSILFFKDLAISRHTGHLLFVLHRLTGIFLLLYLLQHILTNSLSLAYIPIGDSFIIDILRGKTLRFLAIISVGIHGMNGLRLIFIELTGLTHLQKRLAYLVLISGIFLAAYIGLAS